MRRLRSTSLFGLKIALCSAALSFFSGCVAYRIPSEPPRTAHTQQLTLGVERSQRQVSHKYQNAKSLASEQELIDALRMRGTFKQVDFLDRLSTPPDIVLKDSFCGAIPYQRQPLLCYLSLGLIPEVGKTPYLVEFKLTDRSGASVNTVNATEEFPFIVGWVALPFKLNSQWTGQRIEGGILTERFADEVEKAASIYRQSQH